MVPAKWLLKNGWLDQDSLVFAISLPKNERLESRGGVPCKKLPKNPEPTASWSFKIRLPKNDWLEPRG
jgi:hypothetical protein